MTPVLEQEINCKMFRNRVNIEVFQLVEEKRS